MDKYDYKYFDYPDRIVEWLNEHQNEIINYSIVNSAKLMFFFVFTARKVIK